MANKEIRIAAINYNVKMWELADEMGITETSLSRKLRRELPEEEKQNLIELIGMISDDKRRGE